MEASDATQPTMFTCMSCGIAFPTAEEQRDHYHTDFHRYNMKRRVAGLPPVSVFLFNQKVLNKRAETAITTSDKGATCEVCNKTYSTENAYRSHISSKKHRENELKVSLRPKSEPIAVSEDPDTVPSAPEASSATVPSAPEASVSSTIPQASTSAPVDTPMAEADEQDAAEDDENDEDEVMLTLEEKIAAARNRIGVTSCLFCSHSTDSIESNLEHMARTHSFFIPDADYLVDLAGLITYLAEKIAIGNVCLHCNGKGREFRSIHAVRKHMIDKSHCKLAYDTDKDRLEISDYYDFTSSYPEASFKSNSRRTKHKAILPAAVIEEDEEWEDEDEEDVEAQDGESVYDVEDEMDVEEEDLPQNQLSYGDSPYELVLPSGARIGHRSMARYYKQSFASPLESPTVDPNSGAGLVRRLIADKNSALVPSKGGFGAYGDGTVTIKARNRGEAKEAGRHVREFRDQKRREAFKTAVGFRHNSQKHFRDPLLQ